MAHHAKGVPTGRFDDKVVIVTGGTSGIGKATALLFAQEGARVVLTGRRGDRGAAVAQAIRTSGGESLFLHADHRRLDDCQTVVEKTVARFGRIDILFNNAGLVLQGRAEDTSEEDWRAVMELNVTAVWRMSRLVLPHMRAAGKGAIVNNASDWGLVGGYAAVAYCASKGAVVQLTKAMALDHARENIRINAVCPGDTFVERWVENGYFKGSGPVSARAAREECGQGLPMGRVGEAEDIARAVLFLAGDDAAFVTGTTLLVDGGNTAM